MQECRPNEVEERKAAVGLSELTNEIRRQRPNLVINRVPDEELRIFKDISNTEFNGDYGITLKFLVNYFINDLKFVELHQRIAALEMFVQKSSKLNNVKDIKMLDGSNMDRGV
jgi:hypothetical protein